MYGRMTCTRFVEWPQISGPNMIAYGVSPEKFSIVFSLRQSVSR